jgi:hypothetical protein
VPSELTAGAKSRSLHRAFFQNLSMCSIPPAGLAFYSFLHRPQHPEWVGPDYPRDLDELGHVEPTLSALVFGNERLWPPERLGKQGLRYAGCLARANQLLEGAVIKFREQ